MGLKKANLYFGYAFYTIGVLKLIQSIFWMVSAFSGVSNVLSGGNVDFGTLNLFVNIVQYLQIFISIGSIVMLISNLKNQPKVVIGYAIVIGDFILYFIMPKFILMYYVLFIECAVFAKAGKNVLNANAEYGPIRKIDKTAIKNSEWFYSEESKEKNNIQRKSQPQKTNKSIEEKIKEIKVWAGLESENEEYNDFTENKESNDSNILLIVGAAIIFLVIATLLFVTITRNNAKKNKVDIQKTEKEEVTETDEEVYSFGMNDYRVKENQSNNIKNEIAADERLVKIANQFNNGYLSLFAKNYGIDLGVIVFENYIYVSTTGPGLSINSKIVLDGNILSAELTNIETTNFKDDEEKAIAQYKNMVCMTVLDCVGELKGYEPGKLIETTKKAQENNYSAEREGIEVEKIPERNIVKVKINLDSDFACINY